MNLISDIIGSVIDSGAGDTAATAATDFGGMSASDYFNSLLSDGDMYGQLGSGMYGADDASVNKLLDLALNSGAGAGGAGGSDSGSGITGVGWIDKVLANLGDRWNKDPLSLIGTGVGILGKIDAYNKAKSGSGGGTPFVLPPRADDQFRTANTTTTLPPARSPIAPVGPGAPGALNRVVPVQIPIVKG